MGEIVSSLIPTFVQARSAVNAYKMYSDLNILFDKYWPVQIIFNKYIVNSAWYQSVQSKSFTMQEKVTDKLVQELSKKSC